MWYDGPARITGSVLGGWLIEDSAFPWNGPSAEARIQLSKPYGRVRPWLLLGSKHSLGLARIETQTRSELLIEQTLESEWTLTGSMGLSIAIASGFEAGLGVDLPWLRVPNITIPGFHLSLSYRGAP